MYQREPHARQMSFKDVAQPTTYDERCALAERTRTELSLAGTLIIDSMDDQSRALFGDLPTPGLIIGADGLVKVKLPWAEPAVLSTRLKKVLNSPPTETITPRGRLIRALATLYAGDVDDASKALDALAFAWSGQVKLRPLLLRARAACLPEQSVEREVACDYVEKIAQRVLKGPRLTAAIAEINALRKN